MGKECINNYLNRLSDIFVERDIKIMEKLKYKRN